MEVSLHVETDGEEWQSLGNVKMTTLEDEDDGEDGGVSEVWSMYAGYFLRRWRSIELPAIV